jgi:ribonucleotide reductase, class II
MSEVSNMYFRDELAEFVYIRTYARHDEELGRRETWPETVERLVNYYKEVAGDALTSEEYQEIKEAVLNHKVYPSMRLLWSAGKSARRNSTAIYNCAYTTISNIDSFATILFVLLHGTGIGYSCEKRYTDKLPVIEKKKKNAGVINVVFEDSKSGWAFGFLEVIQKLWEGYEVTWDLSKIRPKGAILKTTGGRASGPDPLNNLLKFVRNIIESHRDRKLSPINCNDIACRVAESVVVGGSRRSAMISLSDLEDQKMARCKMGAFWEDPNTIMRSMANNSAVYEEKPSSVDFMREWLTLAESGTGERGIFSRIGAVNSMPSRRNKNYEFGTNPCVTGDTFLLTKSGQVPIGSLLSQPVEIWNGEQWSEVTPFSTGINPIWEVELSNGVTLRTTPYHKFIIHDGYSNPRDKTDPNKRLEIAKHKKIETKDLKVGDRLGKFSMPVVNPTDQDRMDQETFSSRYHLTDAYSQGFYSGDGIKCQEQSYLYSPKYVCADRLCGEVKIDGDDSRDRKRWIHGSMLPKDFVPMNESLGYRLNWFAGLLDSDGCVTRDKNGNGLQIVSVDLEFLRDVQQMLVGMGVQAKVVRASEEGIRIMPNGRGGMAEYECQKTERLLVGNQDTASLMALGLNCSRLDISPNYPQRDARRFITVTSVKSLNFDQETFCVTEPIANRMTVNGIVTSQCAEIILRGPSKIEPNDTGGQFCNLTTTIVRSNDTLDSLKEKMRISAIMGTIQACMINFGDLNKFSGSWQKNTEEERLLGCSLTGQQDAPHLMTAENFRELRKVAVETNEEFASRLGIPKSAAVSTTKPEGTASILSSSSSGVHARFAPYYIRRVRISGTDPLFHMMKDQGVKFYPEVGMTEANATIWVCEFPVKSPEGSVYAKDLTAIQQLQYWLRVKKNYAEHSVSATIYVKPDEWLTTGNWVYEHFDQITGVSFLPLSEHSYQLAPLEECSEIEYHRMLNDMPKINYSKLIKYENEDMTTGAQTLACVGGQCEL